MFEIIATVQESLLRSPVKQLMIDAGATIFRINGAHGSLADIENMIKLIGDFPILLDLPCSKVRTQKIVKPIVLRHLGEFSLDKEQINFPRFFDLIQEGEYITANDGKLSFQVIRKEDHRIVFRSFSNGLLENGKGLHSGSEMNLDFLSPLDHDLIDIARKHEIDYLGLSYVRNVEDIYEVQDLVDKSEIELIPKIETSEAAMNLVDILNLVDTVLVDRGDLSADIGLESIGHYQDKIVAMVLHRGQKVFLATQFLHSMVRNREPTIPEICDLYNCIGNGIHGIQLSDETVLGAYPERCIQIVSQMVRNIKL